MCSLASSALPSSSCGIAQTLPSFLRTKSPQDPMWLPYCCFISFVLLRCPVQ